MTCDGSMALIFILLSHETNIRFDQISNRDKYLFLMSVLFPDMF